jgi:ATP/maltotriose-dependent transcriptional regulator MalT
MTSGTDTGESADRSTAAEPMRVRESAPQARAALDAALRAAAGLTADNLRELRALIDARLSEIEGARSETGLSDREAEALRLIALGYTNKEIASRMDVAARRGWLGTV